MSGFDVNGEIKIRFMYRDRGTDFIWVKHENFLFSLKISYCKNPLLEGPNLGEARASVLHRFRGACLCSICYACRY